MDLSNLQEKPILRIGYHELEGSRVVLKKALAVLRKIKLPPTAGQQTEGGSTGFDVVGVIRQKYLFKTRPRPLISSKPDHTLTTFVEVCLRFASVDMLGRNSGQHCSWRICVLIHSLMGLCPAKLPLSQVARLLTSLGSLLFQS